MPRMRAACAVAMRWVCAIAAGTMVAGFSPAKAEWDRPWRDETRALVIDAYEFNPINWKQLTSDKRIGAFINKASDGLAPAWSCSGLSGDDEKLCKNRWWKYSVTQELYMTRREMAKTLGLKWGAYHLGRPGNPREQADHFVDFAKPEADELIALDIEDNDPTEWMSLAEAEEFARQIKIRLDRYPVLYTNGSTAAFIAQNRETYPLLSRLQLWYARYRDDLTGVFPEGHWDKYALWQFSSMHNCNKRACPYRVAGAKDDIDVNVASMSVEDLHKAWPFDGLVTPKPDTLPDAGALIAEVGAQAREAVAAIGRDVAELVSPRDASAEEGASKPVVPGTLAAAYGPATHAPIDPLQLLTETARQEKRAAATVSPVLSALSQGPKTDPAPPADRPEAAGQAIGTIGQLRQEMEAVRQILSDEAVAGDASPTTPAASVTPVKGAELKSRILELMKAAQSAVEGVPPEKRVEGRKQEEQEEQAELAAPRGGWTILSGFAAPERRIAAAFRATR